MKLRHAIFFSALVVLPCSAEAQVLRFEIRQPKAPIVRGQIIELDYAIVNSTRSAVDCRGVTSVESGSLKVNVTGPDGPLVMSGPGWGLDDIFDEPRYWPGPTWYKLRIGVLSDGQYAFQEPGTYTVSLSDKFPALPPACPILTSEPVTFDLIEAERPGDRALWELMQSNYDVGFLIQDGGPPHSTTTAVRQAARDSLEAILKQYPSVVNSRLIKEALAKPLRPWPPERLQPWQPLKLPTVQP